MAATATPNPPTGVSLIELALGAGYAFADQRWRMSAACAGVDPEVFLPDRGESLDEPRAYCRRCEVQQHECLDAALTLGQNAVGVWGGTSALERRRARQRGLTAAELIAEERTNR
jgi:WhiB family redox-sensing transcriptional regulator